MFAMFLAVYFLSIGSCLAFSVNNVKRNITVLGDVRDRSVELRVLPLGDSITNGLGSTDHNGYRDLFVELAEQGGPIEMIGSRNGTGFMPDNEEEGWDGYTIDQISQKATNALRAKPNLVLLLAGTNNMHNASQAAPAPAEMEALVDKIIAGSQRAVLLVGSILPSTQPGRQPLNDVYNNAVQQMVTTRQAEGKHILLVPIGSSVLPTDLVDGIHPNDNGYERMAVTWVQGVNDAQDRGWFQAPEPGDGYVAPSSNGSPGITHIEPWRHYILVAATFLITASSHFRLAG